MSEELVQQAGAQRAANGDFAAVVASVDEVERLLDRPDRFFETNIEALSPAERARLFGSLRQIIRRQDARFASLLDISAAFGAIDDRDALIELLMDKITGLMNAERSTLFLVDPSTGKLWSKISQGVTNTEIVLAPGEGIAGWVAKTGQSLNIRDAYLDARFKSEIDSRTGYRTHSMVCQPIRNREGATIGVVQVLNSRAGNFSDEDENLLGAIASPIAIALENNSLYLSLVDKNQELVATHERLEHKVAELDLLYDIQKKISQPSDLESLVRSITRKTLELIDGQSTALTLKQDQHRRIYVMTGCKDPAHRETGEGAGSGRALGGDVNSRLDSREWSFYSRLLPAEDSIANRVIETGEPFICPTGSCHTLPGPTCDTHGTRIHNMIALPLFDEDECIGALEAYNLVEADGESFGITDDDIKILTLIASQIATTVASRRRKEIEEKENRLASIGQMISGVLHDFKTPFAIISGYMQLMADTDERATRQKYAANTVNQFRQLNQMTRELLAFARGDTNILLRTVFMHRFMDEVRELLEKELADRGVRLEIELDYRADLRIDDVKMKRAILNLARNAADAMPDGGTFRIRAWQEQADGQFAFSFSDTGGGIPVGIQDSLFESFVTEGKPDGTGLGLAVVKKIVEDHDGTITFESSPSHGTTFSIRIPDKR